ncbi:MULTISPECIES: DUF3275 family protein [Pseudomonas syringae group]|uniref:DUF3275 family protein n=8 Tax=Pseudomonas syringae group TaxID=136849 RepID=A0A2K4X0F3_PSESX|nr:MULTISPECIES: DUF3275 family protein [Pseudomonas syringae group]EGH46602.1 hypothetical protein PSYPI_31566 [Pseudomonas syringae pv. pisi str. 1704B]RMU71026.1 hypothetical protein ALP24_02873 [Pseudomonas syringae pv. aptata]AVB13155.1 DUF3275 domain-containing protein [Pseudomonas amygdali pv. morsprunorum]KUR47073.1 hypothetical protein PST407_02818 [Pseudomonas syringae pv. tomato]KWS56426.1 hypothetical protein AL056_28305 [Pseudomonas amygdali pv. morsprunorum]
MINLPGYLAIRTINGRNGEFNVGRLSTSIGEFVIKDALLDQYHEGKYRGDFAITEIRPSYYTNGGRLVVEIRARLDSMSLDDVANLSADEAERLSNHETDPIDEEVSGSSSPTKARRTVHTTSKSSATTDGDAPFGMAKAAPQKQFTTVEADAELFGTIWPLGSSIKLDTTVDRQRLRQQCVRLGELGYELDFKLQTWNLSTP